MRSQSVVSKALVVAAGLAAAPAIAGVDVGFPQEPALSPDGSMIVFAFAGDLWAVSAEGGTASRLTSHPAIDGAPAFSPDGSEIAFESNRGGANNLFTMPVTRDGNRLTGGQPVRVTTSDRGQSLDGYSADGNALLYSARQEASMFRHARSYRAPLDGSQVTRMTDAFVMYPHEAADGSAVFTRGYSIWNRPIYRGPGSMDLWHLNSGGSFEQLTTHEGNDFAGHKLPDGSVLFISSRDGQNNLYLLEEGRTDESRRGLRQLTDFAPENGYVTIGHGVRDLNVSQDGSTAAFVVWDTMYTMDLTARNPEPVAVYARGAADDAIPEIEEIDLSGEVDEAAIHPSGKAVALVARGEILLRSTEEDRPTRRITRTHAQEGGIAWSADGTTLYFHADDEESRGSIHAVTVTLTRDDILPKEKDEDEEKQEEAPENNGDEAKNSEPDDEAAETDTSDGGGTGGGGSPDESKPGERWAEALTFEITPVVVGGTYDRNPIPSPDGTKLMFHRGYGDVVVMDLESGDERTLFEHWSEDEILWAADSQHVVYSQTDLDFNSDIWLLNTADGDAKPVNITRHPDNDHSPRLSADGKILYFMSERASNANWQFNVHAVYLDRSLENLTDYELAEHFKSASEELGKRKPIKPKSDAPDGEGDKAEGDDKESGKKEPKPAEPFEFDTEDAYLRIFSVTSIPGGLGNLEITPAGNRIIFTGEVGDDRGLFSVDYEGEDRKSITKGFVGDVRVSLDGKTVSYVSRGKASKSTPTGGKSESLGIKGTAKVTIAKQQRQKFLVGARQFAANFYNDKGLDWDGLIDRYADLAEKTRTNGEFNAVFTMLLGEANGSHTGIWGGSGGFDAPNPANGYLGVDLEPAGRGYRVTNVLAEGPSDHGNRGLIEGDIIVSINTEPLFSNGVLHDFHHAMVGTAGEETLLEINRSSNPDGTEAPSHVLLTPSGFGADNTLRYEHGVIDRRAEVDRLSNGRLGYLHIRGMNLPSVRDFERDLYAAAHGKEGLVIDVRDNGGGFTTDILMASLTAPRHAYTIPRGANSEDVNIDHYPRDRRLIYGWTRPINVLINENSFSNAEIFAHAVKTSERGKLVGEQTFGGVISTGGFGLIDGTFIRRPFRGWYLPDGTDMEENGAIPDVHVPMTPILEVAGEDPQLEAAVDELLGRIAEGDGGRAVPVR
ncbi:MAG: S41 family peptidase [Planctomycetota bacterium]